MPSGCLGASHQLRFIEAPQPSDHVISGMALRTMPASRSRMRVEFGGTLSSLGARSQGQGLLRIGGRGSGTRLQRSGRLPQGFPGSSPNGRADGQSKAPVTSVCHPQGYASARKHSPSPMLRCPESISAEVPRFGKRLVSWIACQARSIPATSRKPGGPI